MANSPITKKLLVESQCPNGKCYLRLLSMLPAFEICSTENLEGVIIYMAGVLGCCPEGSRVLTELYIANEMLSGSMDFPTEANLSNINPSDLGYFIGKLFDSTYRYTWEELGGVQHVGSYIDSKDRSREVYNEYGYSSRFVLCMIVNSGAKIGAEENYSNLFGDANDRIEGPYDITSLNLGDAKNRVNNGAYNNDNKTNNRDCLISENEQLKDNLNDRLNDVEKLNDQVRTLMDEISRTSRHQRTSELDNITSNKFVELMKRQDEIGQKTVEIENRDLEPDDSSSNLNRYNTKFLKNGTIFDVCGNGRTQLSIHKPNHILRPEQEIVIGYQRTTDMINREEGVYKRVNPINGLANPFKSHRLNFLCHFNSAVVSITDKKVDFSHYDVIVWISKTKSQSPSQELLYQTVVNTFDLKGNRVIANPYKLPFLEVGMLISDDCLAKCFDLIGLEFKSLWFSEFKSIEIPRFHNDFRKYYDNKVTTNKINEAMKGNTMLELKSNKYKGKPAMVRKKTGGGGSILSFIKE